MSYFGRFLSLFSDLGEAFEVCNNVFTWIITKSEVCCRPWYDFAIVLLINSVVLLFFNRSINNRLEDKFINTLFPYTFQMSNVNHLISHVRPKVYLCMCVRYRCCFGGDAIQKFKHRNQWSLGLLFWRGRQPILGTATLFSCRCSHVGCPLSLWWYYLGCDTKYKLSTTSKQ